MSPPTGVSSKPDVMTEEPARGSPVCVFLSVVAVSWSAVLYGMSLGFTAPAIDVMRGTVKKSGRDIPVDPSLVVFEESQADLFSSLINIGGIVGAICVGPVAERFGRKVAIITVGPMFALSYLLTGMLSNFELLLACRFVVGVAAGMTSGISSTYINEIAPTHLRGAAGACFSLAVVCGIMLVYLLGAYVFVTGEDRVCQWRDLAYGTVVPALILTACSLVLPETPHWLASKGRFEEAQRSLERLRGGARFVHTEMAELRDSAGRNAGQTGSIGDLVRNARVVSIGLMLMVIQQFSGANAVIFFQVTIFQDAGMDDPASLGFFVMLTQVVMTAVSIPLMDTAGRKVLLLIASVGMAICCGAMWFFFLHLKPSWIAVAGSFAYMGFLAVGLGPVPWIMMGELYPQSFRSLACSCGAALNWLCSFVTTLTLSSLAKAITLGNVFALYGGVLVLGIIYTIIVVPETKGRSLAEIERMLGIQHRDVALLNC